MARPDPKGVSSPKKKPRTEVPTRKCIASGECGPKDQMIRFVVGPENEIVPDLAEKLPGRGIWVSASRQALEKAKDKGLFARAARGGVSVSPDLVDQVMDLLVSRCIAHIGLAKKAGAAVSGFEKVEAFVASNKALALLEASDGAEDGRKKLVRLSERLSEQSGRTIQVVGLLNSAELSLAFGRQRVIHAALSAAPVTKMVKRDFARLAGFRPMVPPSWE